MDTQSAIVQTIQVSKSEKTRIRCMQAAISILSQNGLADLTYEAVARRAGVTRPLVKNYFPSLADLIHDATGISVKDFQLELVSAMDKEKSPEKKLATYLKHMMGWVRNYPAETGFWLCFYQYSHVDKKCREANTQIGQMGHKRIAALIAACHFVPLKSEEEISEIAKNVQLIIIGGIVSMLTENVSGGLAKMEKRVTEHCIDFLIGKGIQNFEKMR